MYVIVRLHAWERARVTTTLFPSSASWKAAVPSRHRVRSAKGVRRIRAVCNNGVRRRLTSSHARVHGPFQASFIETTHTSVSCRAWMYHDTPATWQTWQQKITAVTNRTATSCATAHGASYDPPPPFALACLANFSALSRATIASVSFCWRCLRSHCDSTRSIMSSSPMTLSLP